MKSSNLWFNFNKTSWHQINSHDSSKKSLKFKVERDKYKENIVSQLERIRKKETIKAKNNKITNFSILTTKEQNKVGNKRSMPYEIIERVKIGGLQNFDTYDKLNPVETTVRDNESNTFLNWFKRYKYSFILNNLLFSSLLMNDTNVIFVSCNGLIGVINLNEIEHWEKIKGKSKWVDATFTDSEQPIAASHFAFGFTTTNLHDILNFEFIWLDDKPELINFPKTEDKVPILTFAIQVIKRCQ